MCGFGHLRVKGPDLTCSQFLLTAKEENPKLPLFFYHGHFQTHRKREPDCLVDRLLHNKRSNKMLIVDSFERI